MPHISLNMARHRLKNPINHAKMEVHMPVQAKDEPVDERTLLTKAQPFLVYRQARSSLNPNEQD